MLCVCVSLMPCGRLVCVCVCVCVCMRACVRASVSPVVFLLPTPCTLVLIPFQPSKWESNSRCFQHQSTHWHRSTGPDEHPRGEWCSYSRGCLQPAPMGLTKHTGPSSCPSTVLVSLMYIFEFTVTQCAILSLIT